jgi:hypothetical protein
MQLFSGLSMTVVEKLQACGLRARLDGKGGFVLSGFAALAADLKPHVVQFARQNKPQIVSELERLRLGEPGPQADHAPAGNPAAKRLEDGGFRGESFFPSEFSDPLFRLWVAETDIP